jgi:hypothetical protein
MDPRPAAPPRTSFDRLLGTPLARQVGLAAVLLTLMLALQSWSRRGVDPADLPGEPSLSGPLVPHLVARQPDPRPSCRAERCTVALTLPQADPAGTRTAAAPWLLPADALVQRLGTTQVWVLVDDVAVPLRVDVQPTDAATVTAVTETTEAIAPDDWRALGPHGRAKVHHATRASPRLLDARRAVLRHPAATLQPGERLRAGTLEAWR